MNIFFLHEDPIEAAKLQYNKHVVKMILESAQMLCTAHHHYESDVDIPYKKAHYNHPSTKWVRENASNYSWLYRHMIGLGAEYRNRYGKEHLLLKRKTLLILIKKLFMRQDLKKRIEDFNEISYQKDNSKRIIIATLSPDCDKSLINNTVTG